MEADKEVDESDAPALPPEVEPAPTSHVRISRTDIAAPRSVDEKYEIEDELGRGGMGVVVRARDRQLGRRIAMKVLHPEMLNAETVVRRFMVEAQVGAQLEHPNIVPVYGMELEDGMPAFAMRLLGGETLLEYLDACKAQVESGEVDPDHGLDERLERLLKVCDAVAYAHSRGVIHRDLKPANVVLGDHHEVYLVDWGVAKVLGDEGDALDQEVVRPKDARPSLPPTDALTTGNTANPISVTQDTETRYGEMVGTTTYMPPEQASGQLELHGPASDQFSLGMMLQEVVTLSRPRRGPVLNQMLTASLGEREPFERDARGRPAPPALIAIVDKATQKKVEDRYPSVDELADDVRCFLRDDEVSVLPDGFTRRVWKRLSRRPGLVLGVFATVLVVASLGTALSSYQTVEMQRSAAAQSERLSDLTSMVVGKSEAIDARFATSRTIVEAMSVAVEELLAADRAAEGALQYGVAGWLVDERGPRLPDLRDNGRYGFPVTFEMPSYIYPEDVAFESVEHRLRVLATFGQRLREAMLVSLDPEAWTWPRERQDRVLAAGETPIHVTYAAFESGLMLTYPGYEPFPEHYDMRRRPWWLESRDSRRVLFGHPYPDASGSAILVPCTGPVRDPSGRVVGITGADMALDDLAREMHVDHPGWIRSSLIHADGSEIIDTEQEGTRLGLGLHDDARFEARPIEPEVTAAIEREGTGFVRVGDELVVFDRLEAIGWTFLVRLDAREVL